MKIFYDLDSLQDFEFWQGAADRVNDLTNDDLEIILDILEDLYPEGMTDTELNDFLWFEDDEYADWLGYDDAEELWEDR